MQVTTTKLEGVLQIQLDPFEDHRGQYVEIFNEKRYSEEISKILKGTVYEKDASKIRFVEDDISTGKRGVLKGIHGDAKTWKLVQCLYGEFYLVVLNYDSGSKQYGQWQAFTLSSKNRQQILIPPLYGNGHLVLSEYDIYHYKQSSYYDPAGQFTVKWDDPRFNIQWPIKTPILSLRDKIGKRV